MGAWGLYEVRLKEAPASRIDLTSAFLDDRLLEAKLMLVARAHGAARAAFELAVDYARERKQFGQPIGKFQAIQHKLANGLIALEGVRLTLDHAAHLHDREDRNWRYFVNSAVAFAGDALRRVSLETQHTFGRHRLCRGASGARPFQARASRYGRARRRAASAAARRLVPVRARRRRPAAIQSRSRGKRVARAGRGLAGTKLVRRAQGGVRRQAVLQARVRCRIRARYRQDRLDRIGMAKGIRRPGAHARSSRSPSWKPWSGARRRGSARRSRPTR